MSLWERNLGGVAAERLLQLIRQRLRRTSREERPELAGGGSQAHTIYRTLYATPRATDELTKQPEWHTAGTASSDLRAVTSQRAAPAEQLTNTVGHTGIGVGCRRAPG